MDNVTVEDTSNVEDVDAAEAADAGASAVAESQGQQELVRHSHLLGLREQGEGEPRAPHPLDEHAG